jgi:hypothetical protein
MKVKIKPFAVEDWQVLNLQEFKWPFLMDVLHLLH